MRPTNTPQFYFITTITFLGVAAFVCAVASMLLTIMAPGDQAMRFGDMAQNFFNIIPVCVAAVAGLFGGKHMK